MKKIVLVLLALVILAVPFVSTSCGKLPQVAFAAIPPSGAAPLTVVFNNTTPNGDKTTDIVYDWNFGDGQTKAGASFAEAISHEYIKAGVYTVTLTCHKTGATDKSTTIAQTVTVAHGALAIITLTPEVVELSIGQTQTFKSEAFDSSGNLIAEANISWISDGAGTFSGNGTFTAGTVAGIYDEGVTATAGLDAVSKNKVAVVTIKPDPLETTTLESLVISAGENKQLAAVAKDKYGNILKGLETTWSIVDTAAGTITAGGLYTAPKKAGSFTGAIKVTVTQGQKTAQAIGNISISPGVMTQLEIAPGTVSLGKGMTQQYFAAAADKYGNRITDAVFTWNCDKDAGIITANGLFTAGNIPGTYKDSIVFSAVQKGVTLNANGRVTIEPESILYDSDKEAPEHSYKQYIMNEDGKNESEIRLTKEGYILYGIDGSSDGRRLLYSDIVLDANDDIDHENLWICNTDGTWALRIDSSFSVTKPALSPDGTKIAFMSRPETSTDPNDWEIYVMNIDGSNAVNLTNNSVYDAYPDWSPDGKTLVYVSTQYSNSTFAPKVCVMNSDGTNKLQISRDIGIEYLPKWSPDGQYIVFESGDVNNGVFRICVVKAGGADRKVLTDTSFDAEYPCWSPDSQQIVFCANKTDNQFDIFRINRDGSNLIRLTNSTGTDAAPLWLMPKKGITVDAGSVRLKENFGETEMTAQEISDAVRDSVVRIEVTTASGKAYGSGFVIKSNGLILTNNHVISSTETIDKLNVYLNDGDVFTGTVLARDMLRDLALVKIETTGLKAVEIAGFSSVDSGEKVVVFGYPLGNANVSITSGLVSSLQYDDGINTTWIQTDSAINPGNSGGPMFDMTGKVIGVIAAKIFGIGIEGIGYAISAETLNIYLTALLAQAGITL